MRTLFLAFGCLTAVLMMAPSAEAACPIGSIPGVDNFGNQICKSLGNGGTRSIQGSTNSCPPGTHFDLDSYGNKVCKSFSTGQEFHDTSKGCPIGFIQGVDTYGNKVCKHI